MGAVGEDEGDELGLFDIVGDAVVGFRVGSKERVGDVVGRGDVEGVAVGAPVGLAVGVIEFDGDDVGAIVDGRGELEGLDVGLSVGLMVGKYDGVPIGASVVGEGVPGITGGEGLFGSLGIKNVGDPVAKDVGPSEGSAVAPTGELVGVAVPPDDGVPVVARVVVVGAFVCTTDGDCVGSDVVLVSAEGVSDGAKVSASCKPTINFLVVDEKDVSSLVDSSRWSSWSSFEFV